MDNKTITISTRITLPDLAACLQVLDKSGLHARGPGGIVAQAVSLFAEIARQRMLTPEQTITRVDQAHAFLANRQMLPTVGRGAEGVARALEAFDAGATSIDYNLATNIPALPPDD